MSSQKEPRGFKGAKKKTKALLENKEQLKNLLSSANKKAKGSKKKMKNVWNDFQTLFRLVQAWRKGEYKGVPWKTILYATAAIVYFVNPLDLIPDFIPLTGLIDDISIISFVISSLKNDLSKFLAWEKSSLDEK